MPKCQFHDDIDLDEKDEHFLFYEKREKKDSDDLVDMEVLSFEITIYHCKSCLIYRLEQILKILKNPPRKAKRVINGINVNEEEVI